MHKAAARFRDKLRSLRSMVKQRSIKRDTSVHLMSVYICTNDNLMFIITLLNSGGPPVVLKGAGSYGDSCIMKHSLYEG